jgi:hypothetical protein
MLICDVCKKNKATRKITYPTIIPVEEIRQYGIVHKLKREDTEYDICQQCWDIIAINRDYTFRLTKEMVYNKINDTEGNEE